MKRLSLVIPAYCNGRSACPQSSASDMPGRILSHVPALERTAAECGFSLVEVVLVDDGSEPPIECGETCCAGRVPVVVLRNARNMGKGASVKRGALAAKGEWVLMSDVDESTPLSEFAALAPHCGNAIVCGSRRCGRDERPLARRVLSLLFNRLAATGLADTQCGFKLFNMPLMRGAFERQRTERFAFDVELILAAPSVAEAPVEWHGGRRTTLKLWRDAPRMLLDLALIRLRNLFR